MKEISEAIKSKNAPRKDATIEESGDWVLAVLKGAGKEWVDKRPKGGALWVVGGTELEPFMQGLRRKGVRFKYTAGGGAATGYRSSWYLRGYESEAATMKPRPGHGAHAAPATDAPKPEEYAKEKARRCAPAKELDRPQVVPTCNNCANSGSPRCMHGGFSLCDNWAEARKAPEYWPGMRQGAKGWGSSQRNESEAALMIRADRDNRAQTREELRSAAAPSKKRKRGKKKKK